MMRWGSGLLVVVVASVLTGCGTSAPGPAARKPAAVATKGDSQVELVVLSTGNGPKKPVRLEVAPGTTMKMTMYMDMVGRNGSGSAPVTIPTVEMDMTVKVVRVEGDDIDSTFTYDAARVDGRGEIASQMRRQMQAMLPLDGELRTDHRGVVKKADYNVPDELGAAVGGIVESLKSQMQNMTVVYPVEPVGVGARWESRQHVELGGIESDLTYSYEIAARTGDRLVLNYALVGKAPEQDPDLPGMPTGTTVHLERQDMSGSGQMTVDLNEPVPGGIRSTARTGFAMTVEGDGQSQRVEQRMDIKIRLVRG